MSQIGIFFGTDTGTTRMMAKKLAKKLGDAAAKPVNINRASLDDLLKYDALILGTPTYGEGELPGVDNGVDAGSWQEWASELADADFSGKTIAIFGLGDQQRHPDHFADGLYHLYRLFEDSGANLIGQWSTEGYTFHASRSAVEGQFLGLVIDNSSQNPLTEGRLDQWLEEIKPRLLAAIG